MSFFRGSNPSTVSQSAPSMQARKEEVKQQIQQELAVASAQQLVTKMTENCFAKCVTRPGASLSGSEERCLSQCMQLYMAAFDKISQTYVTRITKEGRKP
ncbi:putative mitochondrial import inner membrane translocase subunit tim13 [Cutaneotrichosporon oleaginosum]|uniref:Mitochondrial import inner membrane translocase subunit n=1 Tax=Cutaneotrichosporon oleaginosum TaxID=879819 RepID=A0A0J0XZ13_9TREE|nr:putative mitochondrial import inner membrane translocase subunit tim13 [Cutaneotrichosporon oleaginosum]KLT46303.1 putative mitochondrial import inner membrane translocase subunit tim13 [Cutaneotrichosporon oleaginosum]TXT10305.1 hypothetical protein COLE_04239 [Cutaneotrichosporon oleaginosum]